MCRFPPHHQPKKELHLPWPRPLTLRQHTPVAAPSGLTPAAVGSPYGSVDVPYVDSTPPPHAPVDGSLHTSAEWLRVHVSHSWLHGLATCMRARASYLACLGRLHLPATLASACLSPAGRRCPATSTTALLSSTPLARENIKLLLALSLHTMAVAPPWKLALWTPTPRPCRGRLHHVERLA